MTLHQLKSTILCLIISYGICQPFNKGFQYFRRDGLFYFSVFCDFTGRAVLEKMVQAFC